MKMHNQDDDVSLRWLQRMAELEDESPSVAVGGLVHDIDMRAIDRVAQARIAIVAAARALSRSVGLRLIRPHRGGLRVRFPVGVGSPSSPKAEVAAWCDLALAQREHDRATAKLHAALAALNARRAKKGRRARKGGR